MLVCHIAKDNTGGSNGRLRYFRSFRQMQEQKIIIAAYDHCLSSKKQEEVMIEELNEQTFPEKVYDWSKETGFVSKNTRPCIVDFWAPWCGPCKMLTPVLEEVAEAYKDKVDVYKVNVDEQQELARVFQIKSIPALLFVPVEGKPVGVVGALPKASIVSQIEDLFGIK